ncbi:hypothetical protein CEXT_453571 [Caerostris extrusa]|uniref:Uncharacterized protein n=1 Tax=Caerostris extrusa TaxID=172846 RepID=A0AAV4NEI4_CAEEX|nr:hypothetical protein CEXT_453571 [Caerostris extrusa]
MIIDLPRTISLLTESLNSFEEKPSTNELPHVSNPSFCSPMNGIAFFFIRNTSAFWNSNNKKDVYLDLEKKGLQWRRRTLLRSKTRVHRKHKSSLLEEVREVLPYFS